MSYTDMLQRLKLPTLKYRRLRGDIIEIFNVTIYTIQTCHLNWNKTTGCSTRGNKYKLLNHTFHCVLRKYYLPHASLMFGIAYQTMLMNLDKFWTH